MAQKSPKIGQNGGPGGGPGEEYAVWFRNFSKKVRNFVKKCEILAKKWAGPGFYVKKGLPGTPQNGPKCPKNAQKWRFFAPLFLPKIPILRIGAYGSQNFAKNGVKKF